MRYAPLEGRELARTGVEAAVATPNTSISDRDASRSHPRWRSAADPISQPGLTDDPTSLLLPLLRFRLQRRSCQLPA